VSASGLIGSRSSGPSISASLELSTKKVVTGNGANKNRRIELCDRFIGGEEVLHERHARRALRDLSPPPPRRRGNSHPCHHLVCELG
jgi:hypothetical protein